MDRSTLTQTELGRLLGISQPAVAKLARVGMPTTSLEEAQAWRKRHLDPRLVRRRRRSKRLIPDDAMEAARLRRELAAAERAELDLAARRGELLEVAVVGAEWESLVVAFRARLLLIPPTAAALVAGRTLDEAQAILQRLVNEALGELAAPGFGTPPEARRKRRKNGCDA